MVAGEAAGTAAAYIVEHGVTFRQMAHDPDAVLWLQNQLTSQGAFLVEFVPPRPAVMDHWAYPGLVVMRELGVASGGYTNDYRMDVEAVNRWSLHNRIERVMRLARERTSDRGEYQVRPRTFNIDTDEITLGIVIIVAAESASLGDREWLSANRTQFGEDIPTMEFRDAAEAKSYLISLGVIAASDIHRFTDMDAIATNGQIFSILGALYNVLLGI
jgi:hypothetical protein